MYITFTSDVCFFFLNKWLHNVKSPATCLVHRVSFLNHTMIHAFLSLLLCSPAPTLLGLGSGDRVWFFLCPVSLTLCVEPLYKNWVNKWWMEEWTDEQNLPTSWRTWKSRTHSSSFTGPLLRGRHSYYFFPFLGCFFQCLSIKVPEALSLSESPGETFDFIKCSFRRVQHFRAG